MGLKDEEYEKVKKLLGRDPNYLELSMFAVMWSEHCAYKHSRALLKKLPTKAPWVIQGPGENAGVIDIGGGWAVVFKIESHNHPSAVEPYQGAATGIGGIVRDIFAMGARPIALLDPLRFGSLENARVKYLFEHVVEGIADYGNCIGVPTVGGDIYFEDAYEGNPLVNVMCVGLARREKVVRGIAKGVGNLVVLLGSKTGRDGIHGATFASEELSEGSEERRPSVQVGDPFTEKLLIEACLELLDKDLLVALQDLGAAGLTSSSSEMAAKGGVGIDIDVAKVPRRETGMEPYEVMISESQERMLAIVQPNQLEKMKEVCGKWGVDASVIGQVNQYGTVRIFEEERLLGEVPVKALAEEAPSYQPEAKKPAYLEEVKDLPPLSPPTDWNEATLKLLASPNLASKKWVYSQYDHSVQTNTVVPPGADAAVLRVKEGERGIAISVDGNGRYCYLNPYLGAQHAVAEAARNVAAVGARPMAITNCLNFGNPEDPEVFWQFSEVIKGMVKACEELEIPVVSGNVSFYNEFSGQAIYPTPVIGMVGLVEDVTRHVDASFKEEGSVIALLGGNHFELGGSEYLKEILGEVRGEIAPIDWELEKNLQKLLIEGVKEGTFLSVHDISDGGLVTALAECCLMGGHGAQLEIEREDSLLKLLFGEAPSKAILSLRGENIPKLKLMTASYQVPLSILGHVSGQRLVVNGIIDLSLSELREAWESSIERRLKV